VSDPMSSTLTSRVRRPGSDAEPPPVESPGRARRLWTVLPVCAGFAVFGAIVWLAYQDASLGPPIGEAPLIKAVAEPIKLPPEQVQETTLAAEQGAIGRLWSDAEQADQPERLLPPPEAPLSPPLTEQPAIAEQTLEQPAGQPASEPAAETPAIGMAGEEGASDVSAGALSSEAPADAPTAAAPQPATDESAQEAEAALDRLLAEVTGLSEGTDAPAGAAAAPAAEQGATEVPPEPAESPAREPATTTAAAPAPGRAAPAAPPAKPATEAPPAPAGTSTEVRPAGAVTGAPASEAQAPARPTATAALSGAGAPISPPPVVPDGDFRIQLAAVRGEEDARRAWNLFMVDLEPVLSTVEPIFERAETANGVFYRVQIGPFASQETAESLCDQLKQRNASCFVIRR
jgi:SPOR domain